MSRMPFGRSFLPAARCTIAMLCSIAATLPVASQAAAPSPGGAASVRFDVERPLIDLRPMTWQCTVRDPQWTNIAGFGRTEAEMKRDADGAIAECAAVDRVESWQPVRVGLRWERQGREALNDKVVWLRLDFHVPAEMKGRRLGFFATAVDDTADFFVNGVHLGRKTYVWGARIPEPIRIDITSAVRFGGENRLLIRVNDSIQARGGGLLGHVFFHQTLPFERTPQGGIALPPEAKARYSVVLHLGDALLARGGQTGFSAEALRTLAIPPYILRDDELVLVMPEEATSKSPPKHRVVLDDVSPTHDARPLSVRCGTIPTRAERFELLTIPLELNATYDNPFDPRQISVQAEIETPSGKTEQVSAFFWQDFTSVAINEDEEILLPKSCRPWRVYYRPQQVGRHKIHVVAVDKSGIRRTPDHGFEVVPSARKGFLRVSKHDPRFFEFDNGESYFGIGPSGWMRDANYIFGGNPRWVSTRRLDDYYRRKAQAGSNYDYCLAEFFGRLYLPGGFIDQHTAWKCEHRLRTLEELGIHWVTCYDDLCRSTVYGLDSLPYAASQGGPCRSIPELYFNERALEMQRDHLRYFVGRMSDSPALLLWAIGDEGQAGSAFSASMVRSWIKHLHNYVRTIDVYQHPHAIGEGPNSPRQGGDAIIIPDWYFKRETDAVTLMCEIMKGYAQYNCPLVNPEGGMVEWTKPADALGPQRALYYLTGERWKFPEAISFHNHLWISLFLKNAVGGTEWLGAFIDRKNELYHAGAMRNYLAGESLTRPSRQIVAPTTSHADLRGFSLQSEGKILAWVHHRAYTWYEAGHQGKTPPTIRDAELSVPVKTDGTYRVEYWDTRSGKVFETAQARSTAGVLKCKLPPIEKDVALKMILAPAAGSTSTPASR